MKKHYLPIGLMLCLGCNTATTNTSNIDTTSTLGNSDGSNEQTLADEKSIQFKRADLGKEWPFKTIEEGRVQCIEGEYVVLLANGGGIYALNGTARQVAIERGWKKLDGEQIVGKSISPILDAGMKLCQ